MSPAQSDHRVNSRGAPRITAMRYFVASVLANITAAPEASES
jgi:hypothetical protein